MSLRKDQNYFVVTEEIKPDNKDEEKYLENRKVISFYVDIKNSIMNF